MGRSPASNSKSTSKSVGKTIDKKGSINPAKDIVNNLDAEMNPSKPAGDKSAQEAPKQNKTENKNNSSPDNSAKTVSKEEYDKLTEKYNALAKELDNFKQENNTYYILNKDLQKHLFESQDAHDTVLKQYNDLNKLFEEYKSKQSQETTKTTSEADEKNERLSKRYQDVLTQNSYLTEAIRQGTLKSDKEITDAVNAIEPKAEEVKTDNSGTTEETVAPESEAKVENEPQTKTEQAQATQESAKEANTRPGTGEVDEANMMTPEEAFKYLKNNYNDASYAFKNDLTFNSFVDSVSGKWLPRGYFDAYSAKDGIDPKKFTFEHFKAKIPDNLREVLSPEKATKARIDQAKAAENYDKEYENYNTGFKAYLRRHPKLNKLIKGGGTLGILYGLGQMFNDIYTAGQNDKDKHQMTVESLDDDAPEYPGSSSGNNSPENIAAQLKGADESTEPPEGDSGTIEQAIAEQAPAGNAEPENPQVAANAATPTNTKANNAPASTSESAPTQGLPPIVTRNTPSTNPDSSGMTYSQRVEAAGQAPQAGSMAYNANNPDMVTAGLIDAMNQNSQAGSDAIGYGDLYDQNFIDFWAKRNPNLAFGVSQGRR